MKKVLSAITFSLLASTAYAAPKAQTTDLKINQIQVLGTHNSYSQFVDPTLLGFFDTIIQSKMSSFMSSMTAAQMTKFKEEHPNPIGFAEGLNYNFESLTAQLDGGVRSLAIDLYRDPDGGRFLNPAGYALLKSKGVDETTLLKHDTTDLAKPGLKVLHMADFDFRSNCNLFSRCLTEMAQWSNNNPGHAPIFVMLEAKGRSTMGELPGATKVLPFESTAYSEMDNTIKQVIGPDKVITPDDVRGDFATLEDAVIAKNWPTLASSKGKFIFLLSAAGDTSDLVHYIGARPNLEGRMAFLRSEPGHPHSAFILMDNAIVKQQEIQQRVKQGYLVRTRSDIETYEAKVNDMTRAKAAFSSGAHIISTDFYKAGNPYGTDYKVTLPDGVDYLCNPINSNCNK